MLVVSDVLPFRMMFGLETVVPIRERRGMAVYRAERAGRPVLVKVQADEGPFVREVDTLTLLAAGGAPVLAILETGIVEGRRAFLQVWWHGVTLEEVYPRLGSSHRVEMVLKVGRLLAYILAGLPEGELADAIFWKLATGARTMAGFSWREYCVSRYRRWADRLRLRPTDPEREIGVCLGRWSARCRGCGSRIGWLSCTTTTAFSTSWPRLTEGV